MGIDIVRKALSTSLGAVLIANGHAVLLMQLNAARSPNCCECRRGWINCRWQDQRQ
jgi:hypothetical protein